MTDNRQKRARTSEQRSATLPGIQSLTRDKEHTALSLPRFCELAKHVSSEALADSHLVQHGVVSRQIDSSRGPIGATEPSRSPACFEQHRASRYREVDPQTVLQHCFPAGAKAAGLSKRSNKSGDKKTVPRNEVEIHARVSCSLCSATFSQRCHMLSHVRAVHQGIKQHECLECNSRFARRSYLREHQAVVHDKAKNHVCSECGSKFGWKSELKMHVQSTHGPTAPFTCSLCSAAYSDEKSLARHVKHEHVEHEHSQ
mmetsp:Transcript_13171/g.35480  ORF Transcript_13171/g.35480 Transcript_13171/m.35480 type:complete len:257 (+) Transcript_13171:284-1054(+)|eukprot:CAMPEP_0185835414 /NCGR_PEP_ID=MMETSP1353-20130828/7723_1 /TAXON_ID=1077150 /ORGANISM="Erythrolobus australicus, Strain CCMP3124" /LENGTH=256 /DNA_ID=CAMNT_0028534035 /DNA_START=239 /DNA_END=1009 /DNA_ORIENTATION=-